jgi:DNA polymerase-3 subunit beta
VFEAGQLRAALGDVMKAVPGRAVRPVLSNVLLAGGVMTATDLEIRIDRAIDYHGDPILLPAVRLQQILGAVRPDAEVSITQRDSQCEIRAGSGAWTLPTEDAAEFPSDNTGELIPVCRLPADQFSRAIKATSYATDTESSRYALGAILLDVTGGNPTFVATDGRRMASTECETDQAVDDRQVLLPTKAAEIVCGGNGDSVQIETDGKCVVFSCGDLTVTGRIVEGRFPKWRDVLPDRQAEPWTLERSTLLSAVRAAAIVTSEQSKGVVFTFTDEGLCLMARSSECGEATVTCEHVGAGRTGTVQMDPAFVADYLRGLHSEADPNVTVDFATGADAVVLKCDDSTGVIMPLAKE